MTTEGLGWGKDQQKKRLFQQTHVAPRAGWYCKKQRPQATSPLWFLLPFSKTKSKNKRHNKGRSKPLLIRLFSASFAQILPSPVKHRKGKGALQHGSSADQLRAGSFCGDEGDCCGDTAA